MADGACLRAMSQSLADGSHAHTTRGHEKGMKRRADRGRQADAACVWLTFSAYRVKMYEDYIFDFRRQRLKL
jgi:hypothetical protein